MLSVITISDSAEITIFEVKSERRGIGI